MARDFRRELADAAQTQNVGELLAIAYQLLGRVEADDERRAFQANKKRNQRTNRVSGTSGMSPDVSGRPGTSGDVSTVVPPQRSKTTPPPSAQVIAKLGDDRLQTSLDLLRAKFADAQWEDVASFLLRRKYDRWLEWANAMIRECGPGSQYEPIDLLRVCQDDGTLDRRIGSSGVLRKFLIVARTERVGGNERSPPPVAARSGFTSRRDTKPAGIPAPTSDPDVVPKWQT